MSYECGECKEITEKGDLIRVGTGNFICSKCADSLSERW